MPIVFWGMLFWPLFKFELFRANYEKKIQLLVNVDDPNVEIFETECDISDDEVFFNVFDDVFDDVFSSRKNTDKWTFATFT